MKYLKIILAILGLLIIIFFGSGLVRPSISYENEIVVDAPVEKTWMTMANPVNMGEWLPGFIKMEHVSGIPGMVGSVSKVYFEENGEEMVMEETITKNVPGQSMAMTFTMEFMTMDYEVQMTETDGKTTIRTTSKTEGNGLFAKSMLSFMGGAMEDQEDENLANLKALVERK